MRIERGDQVDEYEEIMFALRRAISVQNYDLEKHFFVKTLNSKNKIIGVIVSGKTKERALRDLIFRMVVALELVYGKNVRDLDEGMIDLVYHSVGMKEIEQTYLFYTNKKRNRIYTVQARMYPDMRKCEIALFGPEVY